MSKFSVLFFSILFLSAAIFCGSKWDSPARFASPSTGAPISEGANIYSLTQDGVLYSVSASDGIPRVLRSLGSSSHIPLQRGRNSIFAATDNGRIFSIALRNSDLLWQYPQSGRSPTQSQNVSNLSLRSIHYHDGILYSVFNSRLIAFSENTGSIVFERALADGNCISSDSKGIYISDAGNIIALAKDGKSRWSVATGTTYNSCPTPIAQNIYVPTTRGALFALDSVSGQILWSYPLSGWATSNPVGDGSSVLFGSSDGYVYSINAQTAKLNFKTQIGGGVWASPFMLQKGATKIAIFATRNNSVVALEPSSGKTLFNYQVSDWVDHISMSDDGRTILAATRDNSLWAILAYPICTLDSPRTGEVIGQEVSIQGRAFSFSPVTSVQLTINSKSYPSIPVGQSQEFEFEADLSGEPLNVVNIQCLAIDSQGLLETDNSAYKSQPVLSLAAPKLNLSIQVFPRSPNPGEKFSVYIRNNQGIDMDGVLLEYMGRNISVSSPYSITAPQSGTYTLVARKSGYYPAQAQFSMSQDFGILPFIVLLIALLAIVGVGGYLLSKKKPQV